MIEHRGAAIVELDIEAGGTENSLTAVLATAPFGPVGKDDRFILPEAQGVLVRPKDHGRDPSGEPRAKMLEINGKTAVWDPDVHDVGPGG